MSDQALLQKIEQMENRIAELEARQNPADDVPALRVLWLKQIARDLTAGDKRSLKAWNAEQKGLNERNCQSRASLAMTAKEEL